MSFPPLGRIEVLDSDARIRACAEMMARSDPWRILYFTVEECERMLHEDNIVVHGWISHPGERLVGFVASAALGVGSEPLLEFLCVEAAHRHSGIGTRMIRFFEESLFPDADNLYLFVSDINPRAVRLYERLGYRKVGGMPDYNLDGQTEYFYRKTRRPRQERYRHATSNPTK